MNAEIITREDQLRAELKNLLECARAAIMYPNELHMGVLEHACQDADEALRGAWPGKRKERKGDGDRD